MANKANQYTRHMRGVNANKHGFKEAESALFKHVIESSGCQQVYINLRHITTVYRPKDALSKSVDEMAAYLEDELKVFKITWVPIVGGAVFTLNLK